MFKKLLSMVLCAVMVLGMGTTAFATETQNGQKDLEQLVQENQTINNQTIVYTPFKYSGIDIRLFKESTLSSTDVITLYPNAYEYISNQAVNVGIDASLSTLDFCSYAKTFAFDEVDSSPLSKEIRDFAVFMDIYENKLQNELIISSVKARSLSDEEIASMMPINSTVSTLESDTPAATSETEINTLAATYSPSNAVSYASSWWNKTNNTSYSYYASYHGLATNTNSYNDLESGASGQSATRRSWYDCADFVSQCLKAGGMGYRKSGLLLPHQKVENWYYDNSKPSHTWGGAPNFYSHWSNRAGVASSSADLTTGDALSVDLDNDGSIDHTIIIVADSSSGDSGKLLSQHTKDRYKKYASDNNYSLKNLYDSGYTIYGYEMDKAPIE